MNQKRVVSGLLVITIGIFLLLNNLGLVDFSVLWELLELWPLLLIAIGFSIIFKEKPKALYATWIIFIIIVILCGMYTQKNHTPLNKTIEDSIIIDKLQETKYGNLYLNLGAAKLTIAKESNNLLVANLEGRDLELKEEYEDNNRTAEIYFNGTRLKGVDFQNSNLSYYDFYLNRDITWDLDLELGAISGDMDLSEISVQYIDLDLGAGDLDIILGDRSPELKFKIDTAASSLNISIPENAGIKVKMDAAFSNTNLNELGLIRDGNYYTSHNYDDADIQMEFDIDLGAGYIKFDRSI